MPDGMHLYEFVLLIAGSLLFVVLLIAFLRQIFTKQPYKSLLMFFLLPIAMIGFPAISEIRIEQGVIEIQKQTNAVREDPNNAQKRASLQNRLEKLEQRPFKNPNTLATIANAQFAVGHDASAERNLNQALAVNPSLQQAQDLQKRIEVTKQLKQLSEAAEKQPNDPQIKEQLQSTAVLAKQLRVVNPEALKAIAKAQH